MSALPSANLQIADDDAANDNVDTCSSSGNESDDDDDDDDDDDATQGCRITPISREAVPEHSAPQMRVDVYMFVNSKFLMHASIVFKEILQILKKGTLKEGTVVKVAGKVEKPVRAGARTMAIIVDVIRGKNQRVPQKLDLSTLIQIALIAEEYKIANALQLISEVWIEDLKHSIPTEYQKIS